MPDLERFELASLVDLSWIGEARDLVRQLELSDEVLQYIVDIVRATREHPSLSAGASPRSTNMLCVAARALAALSGRDYALPDDVKKLVRPILEHRVVLAPSAELEGVGVRDVIRQVMEEKAAPR